MNSGQSLIVFIVYMGSFGSLLLILALHTMRRIPDWVLPVYLGSFVICAIGWELWFTYGWVGGEPVNLRRGEALNTAIPIHINWVVNSLGDALLCMVGVAFVKLCFGDPKVVLQHWHLGAFFVLLLWFITQNVIVEMFLYHDQLAEGKLLSWAPLAPTGPWYNPTLFDFGGRTITLQGQIPWLIMTPLFYWLVMVFFKKKAVIKSN